MAGIVVVTGASSFVGCHLTEAFAAAGWRVLAIHSRARDAYDGIRVERLGRLEARVTLRRLDLRDGAAIAALVAEAAPRLWLQHAGHAENYGSPDYDLAAGNAINVALLAPLYAALKGTGCGVIVTGSSMEYASSDEANREADACSPDTPYGVSKLAQTLAARQLALRLGVPTRVARLYIPFGPLDNPKKLLPMVSQALRDNLPIDLSPCEQRRDFTAVEDVCKGYLALADDMRRTSFDIFNLCGGRALALKSLLLAMAEAAGRNPVLLRFGAISMRPGEPPASFGDNAKARALLRFKPRPAEQAVNELLVTAQP